MPPEMLPNGEYTLMPLSSEQTPGIRKVCENLDAVCRPPGVKAVLMENSYTKVRVELPSRNCSFDAAAVNCFVLPIKSLTVVPERNLRVRNERRATEPPG